MDELVKNLQENFNHMGQSVTSEKDGAYNLKEANQNDAKEISYLFQLVYGNSSHECKDPEYVKSSILKNQATWFIVKDQQKIVACTALVMHLWNSTYETCWSITHPDYRKHGFGKILYKKSLEQAFQHLDSPFVIGFPRTHSMLQLISKGINYPIEIMGHDGGLNIANGIREYHLITLTFNRNTNHRRIIPQNNDGTVSSLIDNNQFEKISFDISTEVYPSQFIVGPESDCEKNRGWL